MHRRVRGRGVPGFRNDKETSLPLEEETEREKSMNRMGIIGGGVVPEAPKGASAVCLRSRRCS